MAKRSYAELATEDAPTASPGKKRRAKKQLDFSDELRVVLEKCEDLLSSISALGSSRSRVAEELAQKLQLQLDGVNSKTREAMQFLEAKLQDEPASQVQTLASVGPTAGETVQVDRPRGSPSGGLQIPSLTSVRKWTSSDKGEKPPLLSVLDPAIETAALTHPGGKPGGFGLDYDRLEWLGDSYIHIISSLLVYQTFPTHTPGRMSQLRELLLRNATVAEFTTYYGLDKRATLPHEFGQQGRPGGTKFSEKNRQKVFGDLFESYFAATIVADPENGVARACDWVKALWQPFIAHHIRSEEARARQAVTGQRDAGQGAPGVVGPGSDAKTRLRNTIGWRGVNLRFEDLPSRKTTDQDNGKLPLFTIGVFMDGWGEQNKLLGQASALSKTEAGQKAAQKILDNKKLVGIYSKKREALSAAAAAQSALPM